MICIAFAASAGCADKSATIVATDSSGATASAPSSGYESPGALTADVVQALKDDGGTILMPANAQEKAIEVAFDDAVKSVGPDRPDAASLVFATVPAQGREMQKDMTKPSKLDLTIKDRLCWALYYEQARIPLAGGTSGESVTTETARLMVLVDAHTGEFLRGETF